MRGLARGTLLLVICFAAFAGCKQPAQTITLKVQVPRENAKVSIDGVEIAGNGLERTASVNVAANKKSVVVKAMWEPNNYTKITRPRTLEVKSGEIVADLREASDAEKDEIVVRFVPTPGDFVDAMCKLAKVGKDDIVYDLGCGDGRMVIGAVKNHHAKRGVGIELDPDLVKKSVQAAKDAGVENKVTFRVGDVLKVEDLSAATVVLLYMGEDINKRLKPILKATLKPGSRVVSHRFLMGDDWPPDRAEEIESTDRSDERFAGYKEQIFLWEIKGKE